jgi:hypothetical protein
MKLSTLTLLPILLTACTPLPSRSTYNPETHLAQLTFLRPNTTPNEALRDKESCRQSELATGRSTYAIDMGGVGSIIMCMHRLGYKYEGEK